MHARRKHQKGSPQEEMEAARRDLEIVSIGHDLWCYMFHLSLAVQSYMRIFLPHQFALIRSVYLYFTGLFLV